MTLLLSAADKAHHERRLTALLDAVQTARRSGRVKRLNIPGKILDYCEKELNYILKPDAVV